MFVEVIVDVNNNNVNQTYYYKVPKKYENIDLLGYRVEIFFGKRIIQGYIVDIKQNIDFNIEKCREFNNLKDEYPVLTKELILLSSIMADELYTNRIQVIETILPTIFKNKYEEYYKIIEEKEVFFEYKSYFQKESVVKKEILEKKLQIEQIKYLVVNNIITLVNLSKNRAKEKFIKYFILVSNFKNIEKLTVKQKKIIDYLIQNEKITLEISKNLLNIGKSVIDNLVKKNILKEKLEKIELSTIKSIYNNENKLNDKQKQVYDTIISTMNNNKFNEYLLYGLTGSGKTEVYIHLTKKYIDSGKDVIILVPEIILTPQIEERFKQVFGENVAIIHSRLTAKEKYFEWKKIKDKKVNICVGTRSAIFAPFENLGLVIIDEEHENSYKQTDNPKYETKDIAQKRAIYNKATLLYASATPSVDLYYKFLNFKKDNLLILDKRYNGVLPDVEVLKVCDKEEIIHKNLLLAIKENIKKEEQVLLFINKRGYTNFIRCFHCNYIYKCENCDISMNYHSYNNTLQCHFCGHLKTINSIKKCCEQPKLVSGSYGIQKIEEYLVNNLKSVNITRIDFDTTKNKGSHEQLLKKFRKGESNILLGTQMISKGLDFPNITLVGILSVENMLSVPSFKTNEKLFQLLIQTSGRAGRSFKKGKVIIQSNIENNILNYALSNDYEGFYNYEINRRKIANYPPFCKISFINIKGLDENKTQLAAVSIYNFIVKNFEKNNVLGPNKSTFYKINNEFRYNIAIRFNDENYKKLHKILKYINVYFSDLYKKYNLVISIDNSAQDYI